MTESKPCPECGGSGVDLELSNRDCFYCKGDGYDPEQENKEWVSDRKEKKDGRHNAGNTARSDDCLCDMGNSEMDKEGGVSDEKFTIERAIKLCPKDIVEKVPEHIAAYIGCEKRENELLREEVRELRSKLKEKIEHPIYDEFYDGGPLTTIIKICDTVEELRGQVARFRHEIKHRAKLTHNIARSRDYYKEVVLRAKALMPNIGGTVRIRIKKLKRAYHKALRDLHNVNGMREELRAENERLKDELANSQDHPKFG